METLSKNKLVIDKDNYEQLIEFYKSTNEFDKNNGTEIQVKDVGHVEYEFKVLKKHQSAPGHCHGGVLAGVMDATLGGSALTYAFAQGRLCATVEFKINYFLPVHLHDELIAEGKLEHTGKRLVHTVAEIRKKDTGEIVAKGIGTFNLYPMEKKQFDWK